MYVIIFDLTKARLINRRKLAPPEKLNAAKFAAETASLLHKEIDWERTSFDGRGDIRVEFKTHKEAGFLRESQSYYFK